MHNFELVAFVQHRVRVLRAWDDVEVTLDGDGLSANAEHVEQLPHGGLVWHFARLAIHFDSHGAEIILI